MNISAAMNRSSSRQTVDVGSYCLDCGQTWDFPTCRQLPNYAYWHRNRLGFENVSLGAFYVPYGTNPQFCYGHSVAFCENTKVMPNSSHFYETPLTNQRYVVWYDTHAHPKPIFLLLASFAADPHIHKIESHLFP